jgi:hypothetical protein
MMSRISVAVDRIEAAERLVEDHEFGFVDDRAEHLDLLPHALAHRLALLVEPVAESVAGQQRARLQVGGLAVHALQLAEVGDDLRRLHLLVETLLFRQIAEAVLYLLRIAVPEHGDLAGVGMEDAHDHADGRCLAGAVLAEEPVDAALGYFERQSVDGSERTKPLGDGAEGQCVVHAGEVAAGGRSASKIVGGLPAGQARTAANHGAIGAANRGRPAGVRSAGNAAARTAPPTDGCRSLR